MFILCLESSHQKGMGHLYRCLNLLTYLNSKNEAGVVLINNHKPSIDLLQKKGISFEVVDLADKESDWETELIRKCKATVWINDRLDTDIRHARKVKKNNIPLVNFDDRDSGSELCDLNFCALSFEKSEVLKGGKVFRGVDYLILNSEIKQYKRLRTAVGKIIVSLGGSDTYGVTINVVRLLKQLGQKAEVHIGPSFEHKIELETAIDDNLVINENVPSLIETFYQYDLAITGGGITPFEANASGLPCIVIANELFEVPIGEFLQSNGSSRFAGYYQNLDIPILSKILSAKEFNIKSMSERGMNSIPLNAVEKIYDEIKKVCL